jgi:hypothetical protein
MPFSFFVAFEALFWHKITDADRSFNKTVSQQMHVSVFIVAVVTGCRASGNNQSMELV